METTKHLYIEPGIKLLVIDTDSVAGLPASGPDDPTVGAKGANSFDATMNDDSQSGQLPAMKQHSVWDE